MSLIGLILNVMLAGLLLAALMMGWRLNRRLQVLRDSHEGFESAVRELNVAAARAEQGLSDLRAATDEAIDLLSDRIEKGRALAGKLERHTDRLERLAEHAPPLRSAGRRPDADDARLDGSLDAMTERRLGALLAAAREARPERLATPPQRAAVPERTAVQPAARPMPPRRASVEDDLFEDEPLTLDDLRGARR